MSGRRSPQRREEILRVALRVFADRGYDGATTVAIARQAGVTQPLVHHHFGSKEGLWRAVMEQIFRELEQALDAALPADGPVGEARVRALLGGFVGYLGQRRDLSRLLGTESSAGGPRFEQLFELGLGQLVERFRAELKAAVDAGVLADIPPALVYPLLVGACRQPFTEAAMMQRAFGEDVQSEAFVARYRSFVVEALMVALAPKG